jgi:hypothetical protein
MRPWNQLLTDLSEGHFLHAVFFVVFLAALGFSTVLWLRRRQRTPSGRWPRGVALPLVGSVLLAAGLSFFITPLLPTAAPLVAGRLSLADDGRPEGARVEVIRASGGRFGNFEARYLRRLGPDGAHLASERAWHGQSRLVSGGRFFVIESGPGLPTILHEDSLRTLLDPDAVGAAVAHVAGRPGRAVRPSGEFGRFELDDGTQLSLTASELLGLPASCEAAPDEAGCALPALDGAPAPASCVLPQPPEQGASNGVSGRALPWLTPGGGCPQTLERPSAALSVVDDKAFGDDITTSLVLVDASVERWRQPVGAIFGHASAVPLAAWAARGRALVAATSRRASLQVRSLDLASGDVLEAWDW